MKILILGGTGFLGPEIVKTAQQKGHTITLFNRGKTHKDMFPDVEKLQGDRNKDDYKSLEGKSWDTVIDTSASIAGWVRASTAALKDKCKHYLYTSSISAYPMNSFQKPGKDEEAATEPWPAGLDEKKFTMETYGAHKARSEQIVMEAFPGHATVIRPGLIVGAGDYSDRFTYWPMRADRGGEILAPGSPDAPVQFIDARDLGDWIVTMVEDGHTGIYNATGPRKPLPMAGLIYACTAIVSNDATLTWVPDQFCLEHQVGPWMEMPLWIPDEPDSRGFSQVSIEKAVAHGLTFRPVADICKTTLDWAKSRPKDYRWRAGLSAEKEAAVLKAWHEKGPTTGPSTGPSTAPSR